MAFDGEIWSHGGIPVVQPAGALDGLTAPSFEAELLSRMELGPGVVAHLVDVPFIDSWGVGALVRGHLAGGVHGSRMAVVLSPAVQHVLETTGLMGVLYVTSSVDQACDEVRRAAMPDR